MTETWINNTIDLDSKISQASLAGYTVISHEHMNRKGGGLICIHKSGLNVQKVRIIYKKSFDGVIVRLHEAYFDLIYRPPHSKKNSVQMLTFLDEFPDFLSSILKDNS